MESNSFTEVFMGPGLASLEALPGHSLLAQAAPRRNGLRSSVTNRGHQQNVKSRQNVLKLSSSYYSIHLLVRFALKAPLSCLGCCCSGWGVPGCTAAHHSLQEPGSRSAALELGVTQSLPAPQRGSPQPVGPKGSLLQPLCSATWAFCS